MSQTDPIVPPCKSMPTNSVLRMRIKAEELVKSLRSNEPTWWSHFPLSWTKDRSEWTSKCLQLGFGQFLKATLLDLDTLFSHLTSCFTQVIFAIKSFQIVTIPESSYLHKSSFWMNNTILTPRITQNKHVVILIRTNHELASPSTFSNFINNKVNIGPYNKKKITSHRAK